MSIWTTVVGTRNETKWYIKPFVPDEAVFRFSSTPRFSHSNDIAMMFSSDKVERDDYLLGLVFGVSIIMSFFTAWLLCIWLCKKLGPDRVGVFSGVPFDIRNDPLKIKAGRITFLFSCVMIMIFSVVFVTNGLNGLQATLDTAGSTNQDIIAIHDSFVRIIETLRTTGQDAVPVRNNLREFLSSDICPNNKGSLTESSIVTLAEDTITAIEKLSTFIAGDLDDLKKNLRLVDLATKDIDKVVSTVQFTGPGTAAAATMIFLITLMLAVALLLGLFEVYSEAYFFVVTWIVLPLFILLVIASYVGAGFFIMLAEVNSDWCVGNSEQTPESTIISILDQRGFERGEMYYETVKFYSSQCRQGDPWKFFESYFADLSSAKANLVSLSDAITLRTPASLSIECGVDFTEAMELLNALSVYSTILLDTGNRAMDMVKCKLLVPLYTRTVYNGSCDISIKGSKWVFGSLITISVFGMLIITLRAVYFPIGYYYKDDGKSGYSLATDEFSDDSSFLSESRVENDVYLSDNNEDEEDIDDDDDDSSAHDSDDSDAAYVDQDAKQSDDDD